MRKVFAVVFLLVCLLFSVTEAAKPKFLYDDPNFPLTAGHADYFEYTDLSSIEIINETDTYYEIQVGYAVDCPPMGNPYKTRYFRYFKDGYSRPQFLSLKSQSWVDIPVQSREDIDEFRRTNTSYRAYWAKFHPNQFAMIQLAVRHLFGIEIYE